LNKVVLYFIIWQNLLDWEEVKKEFRDAYVVGFLATSATLENV
jgi:hypothetical protein